MSLVQEKKMIPQEIVKELDKHIIGQHDAKRAVAIALRNRYRRMHVESNLRNEITPKNILMIGPTGVGKTEIARRLAKLANAPFIKVEATKFTEVGYVGRDVDSIIRDLVDNAVKLIRENAIKSVKNEAENATEARILNALVPSSKENNESIIATKEMFRKKLHLGELEEKIIEIDLSYTSFGVEIMAPPGMEEMSSQLQNIFQNLSSNKTRKRSMKIKDAKKVLREEEAAKLINEDEIRSQSVELVEQSGIVFIDEIDKITQNTEYRNSGEVSREGVQRDLLPLIEGSTVNTKHGMIKTDHILFIASGAFHLSKPSDLIPELQGRLPIRVELKALQPKDFVKILTEPDASLTAQYKALLSTEEIQLKFSKNGIDRIANLSWAINEKTENIGARRLHTVIERILENISYKASTLKGKIIKIDANYVDKQIGHLCKDENLSRFIL